MKENIEVQLREIAGKSFELDSTMNIFKRLHIELGVDYVDTIDFSWYARYSVDYYIRTPEDMVMDICMSQVEGMLHAMYEAATSMAGVPKVVLDMDEFISTISDLAKITTISYSKAPISLTFKPDSVDTATKSLSEKDRAIVSAFRNELGITTTLFWGILTAANDKFKLNPLIKMTEEWTRKISDVFISMRKIGMLQKAGGESNG